MQYKHYFKREQEGLRMMLYNMSELFLISHNALPKKQFITRTERNPWRLALHDDQAAGFSLSQNNRRISLSATASFEEQLPDYHHQPLLQAASPIRHVSLHVTVLVSSAHFHLTELCTAFWRDLLYQNYVLWQPESQNNFSQSILYRLTFTPCFLWF